MKGFFAKPYRFALVYGAVLILFAAFVLLDTFVIPRRYQSVPDASPIGSSSVDSSDSGKTDGVTADPGATDPAGTEPEIGEFSYRDDHISIEITTLRQWDTDIYVAEVILSSPEYLKTAFANGTYGRNIKRTVSDIAEDSGAIFAVNGDYYGFRNAGYVIRNGVLYRSTALASDQQDLVIGEDGRMYSATEGSISAEDLLADGVEQVLSFGPVLVEEGKICVDGNDEVGQSMRSNPRTAVGMIEPLHYIFVVSDGRTDQSEGLSLYQLAQVLKDQGCTFAYNLDGGGSATMVFNGQVINNPTDGRSSGERKVSDIVCIGY